jgi:hypothetical protein
VRPAYTLSLLQQSQLLEPTSRRLRGAQFAPVAPRAILGHIVLYGNLLYSRTFSAPDTMPQRPSPRPEPVIRRPLLWLLSGVLGACLLSSIVLAAISPQNPPLSEYKAIFPATATMPVSVSRAGTVVLLPTRNVALTSTVTPTLVRDEATPVEPTPTATAEPPTATATPTTTAEPSATRTPAPPSPTATPVPTAEPSAVPTTAPEALASPTLVPNRAGSGSGGLRYDPSGPDRDCGDFDTQQEAQAFFIAAGGPEEDPHRLDGDHDGVVCETLP